MKQQAAELELQIIKYWDQQTKTKNTSNFQEIIDLKT